jgi:hypothetical protein
MRVTVANGDHVSSSGVFHDLEITARARQIRHHPWCSVVALAWANFLGLLQARHVILVV